MARRIVAALLEVGGIAAVTVAGFMVDAALGWLSAGIGAIVFGLAIELGARPAPDRTAG